MSWQGGVGALFDTQQAVASNNTVLHHARWNDARPHVDFSGRDAVMQELDAKADGTSRKKGGSFPKTTPRARTRMSFAGGRRGAGGFHTGSRLCGDEGLWGAGVEESDKAVTGGGGRTAVDFDSGGKECVIRSDFHAGIGV